MASRYHWAQILRAGRTRKTRRPRPNSYATSRRPLLESLEARTLLTAGFNQGFEVNNAGWDVLGGQYNAVRVPSGTHGVSSHSGAFHAEAGQFNLDVDDGSAFTRFGGYSSVFPAGGFHTSVSVYLNVGGGSANDTRFDWDSAISDASGNFGRDFVFNAGYYNDSDATGSGPRFVISASNNAGRSSSFPNSVGRDPFTITTTGWYTLDEKFTDGGGGVLKDTLTIANSAGTVLHAWTLSNPTDVIGTTVGGNRYGWFASQEFPFLAFDDSLQANNVPPNTVYVDGNWAGLPLGVDPDGAGPATAIGVDAFGTIQAGIDGVAVGGTVNVRPGTYHESPHITKSLTLAGDSRDTTTIDLLPADAPSGTYLSSLQIGGQNVTVSGFTIVGNSAVGSGLATSDIYVESGLGTVNIQNNRLLVGQIGAGANGDDGMGILTTYTTPPGTFVGMLNVSGNEIVPAGPAANRAFYVNPGVATFDFSGNTISGEFDSRAFSQANNADIENNHITGTGSSKGIGVWGFPDAGIFGHALIKNNDFSNLSVAVSVLSANNVTIENNSFQNSTTGVLFDDSFSSGTTNIDYTTDVVHNNSFTATTTGTFTGIQNNTSATINASNNWWGSPAGPSGSLNSSSNGTGEIASGNVTVAPWLTDGTDTQPAVPGIQPNSTSFAPITNDLGVAFSTIQAAIHGTPAGHVITIADGLYHESNILVSKSLTIQGQSRSGVILGPALADGHQDSSFGGSVSNGFVIGANGVTIQNMTIDGDQDGAIAGTQNFRNAIITDYNNGDYGDIHLDRLSIQNIFRKGVGFYVVTNDHATGDSITSSSFSRIGTDASLGFEAYFAIAAFQSDTTINHVDISHSGAGIGTNYFVSDAFAPKLTISDVTIHDMLTSGTHPILGLDVSGLASGSTVSSSSINVSGGSGHDLAAVLQYAASGADVTFSGNTVTTDAGDTGVYLYQDRDSIHPVVVRNNTLIGSGSATGIVATDDGSIFGETPHVGMTYATLAGNTISGYATGISLATAGTTPVGVKIGGALSAEANSITGDSSGTGIAVSGANSTATISGNIGSVHGFDVGINVSGGSATITDNHIYNNATGIRFTSGGTGSVDGDDFAGGTSGPDNRTDLLLDSTAGTLSSLTGNAFAGDSFYLDDHGAQSFNLASTGTTFDVANNFRIEDHMHHRLDTDLPLTTGLVTWVAGNLYVTTPGSGSTDSSIQRGVDAAASGNTVNLEAGTYAENITIMKSLTLLGAQHGAGSDTRFGAFASGVDGPKADPSVESIITAATSNPTAGNPNANDLIRTLASNITLDGLVIDGNNPAITAASSAQVGGIDVDARRGITNIDAANNTVDINNLTVANNILQNFGQRGISLSSSGAALAGNSISGNVIRNFADAGVIVFGNAYTDITSNTLDAPAGSIGLQLQNFFGAASSMTWSANQITVGQDGIGIHANLFYAPGSVLNIAGNTVNAAAGVTGTSDFTWGINVWSVQVGATVNLTDNIVGSTGGELARGINLWNLPTATTVTVSGGSVGNSLVGVNLDGVDPYFGGGADTMVNLSGINVTAKSVGLRVRNAPLVTPPQFGANVPAGTVRVNLTGGTFTAATAGAIGILVQDNTIDAFTASLHVSGTPTITGGTIGIKIDGPQTSLISNTLASATFSGQSGDYITLSGGALAGQTIDGTAASFDGTVGNAATTAQGLAIEDKITHAIDDGSLGFIRVKTGQVFVTPGSFVAPATTAADIQRGINAAAASDTIHVAAGTYNNNPNINKPLTLLGANAGTAGDGVRGAETSVVTSGNQTAVFTVSSSGVTIDGFTIDGDDPLVTGAPLASGDDANVSYGVRPVGALSNVVVQNNIVRHVFVGFRGDASNTTGISGNRITHNWFNSIGNFDFGYAVSLRTGFYADVTSNLMTRVWTGVHLNDFHVAGPATWSISGNTIHDYAGGILYWLEYGAATSATISGNQISAETGAVVHNFGLLLVTVQDTIHPAITSNAISNTDYGVGLFNVSTSNNITLDAANSVSGAKLAGVLFTDNLNFNPIGTTNFLAGGPGAASTVKLAGMPITNAAQAGVIIDASGGTATNLIVTGPQTIAGVAGSATVGVDIQGALANANLSGAAIGGFATGIQSSGGTLTIGTNNSITGGTTGLAISGTTAAITGQTLNDLSFSGQSGPYITLSSIALSGQTIDGTAASFDGTIGNTATTARGFAIEDKLVHAIDNSSLGFIRVKTGQVFVTPSSFIAPATTSPDIQRAVAEAATGDTINVAAGTYHNDVNLNKDGLSLLGTGPATTTISGPIGAPSSTIAVTASNVTIAGFTITRDGNNVAQWNDPALNSAGISIIGTSLTGMLVHDNVISGNRTGIDVNNSSGHTIRNNVITDNRTGLIFRNQTDNLTVAENSITNNWTLGIVFLDASGGTNSPVQTAQSSTFTNNDLSGNWYGQIVDRQAGGSLPAPGTTNLKNFSGNWFGSAAPIITTANSAEPGYAAQIPVEFGGTATAPGGQPDIAGPASANFDISPFLATGADTDIETTAGRGTFGFQGNFSQLVVTSQLAQTGATPRIQEGINAVANMGIVQVTAGTYSGNVDAATAAKNVTLSPGAGPVQVTINGNLSLDAGDTLAIGLNGASPTTGYDNLIVNGTVSLGGATLAINRSFMAPPGSSFTLINNDDADPVSGTFNGLAEGATITLDGIPFTLSYAGGDGNDVTLTEVSPALVYVNDTWLESANASGGTTGVVEPGDTVTSNTAAGDAPLSGLIFGYNAFATIGAGVAAVASAGTVNVLAGSYSDNVTIDKPLTLIGANAGIDPNLGSRTAESVVTTAVNDVSLTSAGGGADEPTSPIFHVRGTANGVTIDGFEVDGINPALGPQISASGGIYIDRVSGVTIRNNVIQEFVHFGVSGLGDNGSSAAVSTNNLITANKIQNILGQLNFGYGEAIDAANNFYVSITDNVISNVRRGMQLTNNYLPNSGAAMVVSGNQLDVGQAGIWLNLWYGTASGVTISNNDLTSTFTAHTFPPAADSNRGGLFFSSLDSTIGPVAANGNTIHGGYDSGVLAWNNAKPLTVSGGTIDGGSMVAGVRLETANATYGDAGSSGTVTLDALQIQNAPTGIIVDDNSTNSSSIGLNLVHSVQITGGTTGLVLKGHDVALTGITLESTQFAGQSGSYIVLSGGALGGQRIDGTTASYDGVIGSTATTAQGYAIEDKMIHKIDDSSVGFVSITPRQVFITPASFVAPQTAANLQNAVAAAQSNDTVHIAGGSYTGDVNAATAGKILEFVPGTSSPAQVVINGNLSLGIEDTLLFRLHGTDPLTDYDNYVVNGTVSLGSTATGFTELATSAGANFASDDVLKLISNNGVPAAPTQGHFFGKLEGAVVFIDSQRFVISYASGDGNDVTLTRVNEAPTVDSILDRAAILEDAATQTVSLTGISAGVGDLQTLTITATSSNPGLIPNPTITYTSPNNSGSLSFTPVPNQYGTATITLTVHDDGGTANGGIDVVTRTFTVTVTPVNDPPTVDAIVDPPAILEDAAQQTISLTGISAGPTETQTLTITATSSNPGLIPDPTVNYTSPNNTGSLSYTPVANQSGTATITVTIRDDGGTANGGVDVFTRTFTVTVIPVNNPPTLDAITDPPPILEDAAQQTINLTGISAGPDETQTLTVTATSSNPGLIPDPTVTYASSDSSAVLSYIPVANQSGTATITVTVHDDGLTANGGVDTFTRTFTVIVTPVNDPPSFVIGDDKITADNVGPQTFPGWATSITAGPPDEAGQQLQFVVVDNTKPDNFLVQPSIDANGTLTFTPAPNAHGVAHITIQLQDNGGTANGGSDTSAPQTFKIEVKKLHALHNSSNSFDVDDDGHVAPNDALAVIEQINAFGSGLVSGGATPGAPYFDVTDDDFIAPIDALFVINQLNSFGPSGEGELNASPTAPAPSDALLSLLALDIASQPKRRR